MKNTRVQLKDYLNGVCIRKVRSKKPLRRTASFAQLTERVAVNLHGGEASEPLDKSRPSKIYSSFRTTSLLIVFSEEHLTA